MKVKREPSYILNKIRVHKYYKIDIKVFIFNERILLPKERKSIENLL